MTQNASENAASRTNLALMGIPISMPEMHPLISKARLPKQIKQGEQKLFVIAHPFNKKQSTPIYRTFTGPNKAQPGFRVGSPR